MKESVVFIPGMMCDARLFAPQIEVLSRERVVAVAPATQGERIEEIASQMLDQLPARFALAGHGLGGMVAMELLRRSPARITRLCLMATDAQAETPEKAAAREPLMVGIRAGRLEDVLKDVMPPERFAPGPERLLVRDRLLGMARDQGTEVFLRQSRALQRRRDQQVALGKATVPTLILCGEHDETMPRRHHEFLAELMPSATLRIIAGAGHYPTLEQPGPTNEALGEWLARRHPAR